MKLLHLLHSSLVLVFLLALMLMGGRTGDPAQLAQAEARYSEGMELLAGDPNLAREKFRESADILAASELDTAGMHFNRANALLRAGDLGEAIASYRAAQLRAPADTRIAANLAEARGKILRSLGEPAPTTLDQARGLWSWLGEHTRLLITAALGFAAIIALSFRARATAIACAALGAIFALTVAADITRRTTADLAVVTAPTTLRKGNGEGFDPVFAEPLPVGTECRLLESRPGWLEIEIRDSTRGWVKATTAVRVP